MLYESQIMSHQSTESLEFVSKYFAKGFPVNVYFLDFKKAFYRSEYRMVDYCQR